MTTQQVLVLAGITVGSALVSMIAVALVLVRIPPDYFSDPKHRTVHAKHPAVRWTLIVLKNLLGLAVVAAGLLMSLPGVPGQGLLTILLGIMLVDFPGKYRLERAILRRPAVLGGINRLRARFGRAALVLPTGEP